MEWKIVLLGVLLMVVPRMVGSIVTKLTGRKSTLEKAIDLVSLNLRAVNISKDSVVQIMNCVPVAHMTEILESAANTLSMPIYIVYSCNDLETPLVVSVTLLRAEMIASVVGFNDFITVMYPYAEAEELLTKEGWYACD